MTELPDDLRELDACFASVPLPEGLEARIVAGTMVHSARPSTWRWSLAVGLAFAGGVVLGLLVLREPGPARELDTSARFVSEPDLAIESPGDDAPRAAPAVPGLSVNGEGCEWSREGELLELAAGCRARLAQPAMALEVWAPARVALIGDGVAVREGEVMFLVEHVDDPRAPAKVAVSGGTIEILGTRFVVSQTRESGWVDLIDGVIQFRHLDGELETVEPGRRHRWTTPGPANSASSLDAGGPPSRALAPTQREDSAPPGPAAVFGEGLAEGLAEVARLRRAGELDAAIARLDELARAQDDARTLEVISYERGTLVERSAAAVVACEAWTAHRRRFPSGRYDAEVERRIAQLACVPK